MRRVNRQFLLYLSQLQPSGLVRSLGLPLALFSLVTGPVEIAFAADDTRYVQISATKLRKSPQQWAAGISDLSFGDPLKLLEQQNSWLKVQTSKDDVGYVHESAVTEKRIVLSTVNGVLPDITVDDSEVYLAGKGFNNQIESEYKVTNKKVNFGAVDAMHSTSKISETQLEAFIRNGKLNQG